MINNFIDQNASPGPKEGSFLAKDHRPNDDDSAFVLISIEVRACVHVGVARSNARSGGSAVSRWLWACENAHRIHPSDEHALLVCSLL